MSALEDLLKAIGGDSESLLLAALDQLAEGVIVADKGGELIYVNKAAARIHGVDRLHVAPDEYSDTYHLLTPEGHPHPFEALPLTRAVMKGETVDEAHWKVRRPDGSVVDALGSARPVRNADGEQIASVLTLEDETKTFEQQAELEEALEAKETLLYEVNHRTKNNLAMVTAMLSLHARRAEDETVKRAFADVSSRIKVIADIHSRLYQTGSHHRIEIVAFLAKMFVDTVQALGKDRGIEARVKRSGRLMMGSEQVVPLALALNELVLNSIKHAFDDAPQPLIEVEIAADSRVLTIDYADNGPGLGSEENGKRGGGIGRALVGSLSSQLDGSIEVRTDQPGYCARIEIPILKKS